MFSALNLKSDPDVHMDSIVVSEPNNNTSMPTTVSTPNYPNHLSGFDLAEALASAEESRRRFVASKSFVSTLPAVHGSVEGDICSICMEVFDHQKKSAEGNKRVPCGHVYHAICISRWLSHCSSCPLCRFDISIPI